MYGKTRAIAKVLLVAALVAIPSFIAPVGARAAVLERAGEASTAGVGATVPAPLTLAAIAASPRIAVPGAPADLAGANATPVAAPAGTPVLLLLTLPFENASRLTRLVAGIDEPTSADYHDYLTRAQFTAEFAPNAWVYGTVVDYLGAYAPGSVTTYPDRLAVAVRATPAQAGSILGTPVERFVAGNLSYWAASEPPSLPALVESDLASVAGLGPASGLVLSPQAAVGAPTVAEAGLAALPAAGGALAPVTNGSVQYLYPADLQTAYDEESLFDLYGYPSGAAVAAILGTGTYEGGSATTSCGSLSAGTALGPYDPSDLSSFFANTTPSGEPRSQVVNVSVDGSASPDCRASYDGTGVVAANTAQLEALGELVPGATIYGVTVPGQPTVTELGTALETILSPPTMLPRAVRDGLANVTTVTIGWAAEDQFNVTWLGLLQQASALGLSLVTAVGNSGDNPLSTAWNGSAASFPASAANETAGSLAVGGTTLTLNTSTDQIASQVVWNVSSSDTAGGGPLGSAGGISALYSPEPAFQSDSSANLKIAGAGRGLPDVAAVANNTLVTLTVDGYQYLATNATDHGPFRTAFGTGVAAAVVAGIVAEIDHTLAAANNSRLGYVDPELYAVANEEYSAPPSGGGVVSTPTGTYDSELPTVPFRDVVEGRNDKFVASVGYDLVTGWGSLDAYNYTMYVLDTSAAGVYGALDGLKDRLHLAGLEVTSGLPGGGVDRAFNASVQQDFFVANSLGAPVYSAQAVVDLVRGSGGLWDMNFSAWLGYPFRGFYPSEVVQEDDWSHVGGGGTIPLAISLTTRFDGGTATSPPQLIFTFQGAALSLAITLDVPGGSYIIGRTGYTYSWQGTTYEDGPTPGGSAFGYLAPQLDLVGGSSAIGGAPDAAGSFGPGTSGNFSAAVVPAGSTVYIPAEIGPVTSASRQTPASATNLTYSPSADGGCNVSYSPGTSGQGAYTAEAPFYPVKFTQTGVPDGASWYVNLTGGTDLEGSGSTDSLMAALQNGTYDWTAGINEASWEATPPNGTVIVEGKAIVVALTFAPGFGSVTFDAKGPEINGSLAFMWYVNISGQPPHNGTALSYLATLPLGTYPFKVACADPEYAASRPTGSITIGVTPIVVDETFAVRTYTIEFEFQLPKPYPHLTISMAGVTDSGVFSTWALNEPNGSYAWSITGLPFGYGAVPAQGVVNVHGPVKPIVVKIGTTGWGPFGLGLIGYTLVIALVGIAAVWSLVYLLRRRRRRQARGPPPTAPTPPPPPPKTPPRKAGPRPERELRPEEI